MEYMKKNGKKFTAVALATVMGLGYITFPAHAEEKTEVTDYAATVETNSLISPENGELRAGTNDPAENSVASVEINAAATYYDSVVEAFNQANGNTAEITVLKDCVLTADVNISAGNITVYGQGKSITSESGANINITGGTLTAYDFNHADTTVGIYVHGGTLNFHSGKVSFISADGRDTNGVVNIYGGYFDRILSSIYAPVHYYVQGITINQNCLSIEQDSQYSLEAEVQHTIYVGGKLLKLVPTWSSSNPTVAAVDDLDGTVSALAPGKTTITATTGGKSASCEVTVMGNTSLSITTKNMNKTYDGTAVAEPDVEKTGSTKDVTFAWYQKDGDSWTELSAPPVNAGSYKVVASVEADDNYSGAETEMTFEISKVIPSYTLPADLIIKQGEALSTVKLPDGFTWKDDTQIADTLGTQPFKAVFTPEDTANYQTVEVDIIIEVVPALTPVNHIPTISAEDKTLTVGDTFDPKKNVTASDTEDGDLTDKIEIITNNVDTTQAGTYEVIYRVTDTQGVSIIKMITVTVKEKTTPQTPNKDNDKTDKPDKKDGAQTTAKTGDYTSVFTWSALSILSAIGLLFTALFRRRRTR